MAWGWGWTSLSSSSLPKPPWWQVGEGVGGRGRVRVQGSCHLVSRPAGWQTGSWHRVRSPGAAWLRELQPLLLFFFFRVSFWEPTFYSVRRGGGGGGGGGCRARGGEGGWHNQRPVTKQHRALPLNCHCPEKGNPPLKTVILVTLEQRPDRPITAWNPHK